MATSYLREERYIVKGALHADQIDDMRLMLSKARDGSVTHGAATSSAAAPAPAATAKASTARAATLSRETSVQRRAWKGGANKASAKFQGIPPSPSEGHFPPLTAATTTWRQAANRAPSRPRPSRRAETPHPTLFATDAEVAAMTPQERALHETQVSLLWQLVNRFSLGRRLSQGLRLRRPPPPTSGGASSSTPREPFLAPWRPERLPLTRTEGRPSTRLEEKSDRRVNFDPRGPYPPSAGATERQ